MSVIPSVSPVIRKMDCLHEILPPFQQPFVPLTWDLFVRTAVREVMTIIPPPAKTRRNALTAAKTTSHDRVTAKFGRKKRKFVKSR